MSIGEINMVKDEVIFFIQGKRIPTMYNRNQLRVGAKVYVSFDLDGNAIEFSPAYREEDKPFSVNWISPSEWVVILDEPYNIEKIPLGFRNKIEKYLDGYLEPSIIEEALKKACKDIRLEHQYKTDEIRKSRIGKIYAIIGRFDLIETLHELPRTILWSHQTPLSVYFILTCFDLLGQPDGWLDFGNWLNSKKEKHLQERQKGFNGIKNGSENIEQHMKIHNYYIELYGMRRSFYRFITDILPDKMKDRLLASIDISIASLPPSNFETKNAGEKEKIKYLFYIRNSYTHSAQSPSGFPIKGREKFKDETKEYWDVIEQIFEENCWKTIMVKEWPDILYETVKVGLAEYLKQIASMD
jgi:hypothetical protein